MVQPPNEQEHTMRGVVMHAPGDVRVEDRPDPTILEPTDAIIRMSATCICGSDLWPYRGIEALGGATPMGHEYCGSVEEVGSAVTTSRRRRFNLTSHVEFGQTWRTYTKRAILLPG